MPLRAQCSAGHLMMVPDHRAGTVLRCPNCGIDVQVPGTPQELPKPRMTMPSTSRSKSGNATSGRQSPRVAGHASAKSGIGMPSMKPPPKSRAKSSSKSASKKPEPATSEESFAPTAPIPAPVPAPVEVEVITSAAMSVPITIEAAEPDIAFTSPLIIAPTPLAKSVIPTVNDAALIETVDIPVKKLNKPKPVELYVGEAEPPAPPVSEPPPPIYEPQIPVRQSPFHSAATQVDAKTFVPPQAAPQPASQSRPAKSKRPALWPLALALVAAWFLSVSPAVWEFTEYFRGASGFAVPSWAFMLLTLGMVQLATIVLLLQVPDWASVWIVTLQALAIASIYAAILGLTIITNGGSSLVSTLELDQQYTTGRAQPWCILLAATYAAIALYAGRISSKWRKRVAARHAAAHA